MFTGSKKDNKMPEASFPKIMISDETFDKPYYAIVIFEKPRHGMCLQAHDASHLKAGRIYSDIDMEVFRDYEGTFEIRNTFR